MSEHLVADLREDEGEVLTAYQDHMGFWTIGVGILIDKRKRGGGITSAESAYLLGNRIDSKTAELRSKLPWFDDLDEVRQCALLNMAFQMGVDGLLGFKNSLALVKAGSFQATGEEMKHSLWAKQTPARALRVITSLQTGKYRHGI
jgi:lysozyme